MKKQCKKQAKQRVFPRTLSLTLFSDSFFCDCQLCVATLSLSPQCNDDTLSLHSAMTMTIVDTTMFRCFLCSNESSSFVDLMTCVACTLVQARDLPKSSQWCIYVLVWKWPTFYWFTRMTSTLLNDWEWCEISITFESILIWKDCIYPMWQSHSFNRVDESYRLWLVPKEWPNDSFGFSTKGPISISGTIMKTPKKVMKLLGPSTRY